MKYLLILFLCMSAIGCAKHDEENRQIINADNLNIKCTQDKFSSQWIIDEIISEYIWLRSVYGRQKDCIQDRDLIKQYQIFLAKE